MASDHRCITQAMPLMVQRVPVRVWIVNTIWFFLKLLAKSASILEIPMQLKYKVLLLQYSSIGVTLEHWKHCQNQIQTRWSLSAASGHVNSPVACRASPNDSLFCSVPGMIPSRLWSLPYCLETNLMLSGIDSWNFSCTVFTLRAAGTTIIIRDTQQGDRDINKTHHRAYTKLPAVSLSISSPSVKNISKFKKICGTISTANTQCWGIAGGRILDSLAIRKVWVWFQ